MLAFLLCLLIDVRIPQPLPKGTPEPPLAKQVDVRAMEGHYLITGADYKSTARIIQPSETKIFIVYQYTGATVMKGVGIMDGDRFIIGWGQDKTIGVTSIRFRDGTGQASWTSVPGNGKVSTETWKLIADE